MSISALVKGRTARFLFYRDGYLYYEVVDTGFVFPVPISDTGKGTFNAEHKAITLMRWIRVHAAIVAGDSDNALD